jgi:hypothetical protein
MIEQPPKVYLYQPKISGFNMKGQRGSKYFKPSTISMPQHSLVKESQVKREPCQNPKCAVAAANKIDFRMSL